MGVALENALNCDHGRSVLVVLSRALAAQSKRPHIDDEWLQFVSVKGPLVPFVVRGDLEQPKQIFMLGSWSDRPRIVIDVSHFDLSWQGQYLVTLEGHTCCPAHCK